MPKRLVVPAAILLAAGLAGRAWADTYPKNPNVDVLNYTFRLVLHDHTDEIQGEATIDVRFLTGGVSALEIDLAGVGTAEPRRGMTVSSVTSAGRVLEFRHEGGRLTMGLPSPTRPGDRVAFTITYRGIPATGLVIGPNKHGDRTFFSDNWPDKARQWLPMLDHPSDKSTCEFIVTAPAHYQVISNGLIVEETDLSGALRRTHWRQSVPIATWLYALGVARFAVQRVDTYHGAPIETWVYPQDRDAGFHDFAVPSKDVLEFYGSRIGPYSYEKLANVQARSVGGGMEAATAIFYGEGSVTGRRDVRWRNVVIHEIAHQWWGNAVTEHDWDDVWLSEGFATYFTLLFIEHAYGRDEFAEGLRRSRDSVRTFDQKTPNYRIVHDNLADMRQVATSQIYQKGGWVLHMLRGLVGTERFWAGIREYYRLYRDRNATTANFRRVMEETTGQQLGWFFDQWLYQRGGIPKLRGGWRYDPQAKQVEIELDQVQSDQATYRMPIEVAIAVAGDARPRIERITLSDKHQRFVIASDREPSAVALDPNLWVLMDAEFERR